MLPMVTMPAPSTPLGDYSALRRRFTVQGSPTDGPPGEATESPSRTSSPTSQRRMSNLYRVLQRRPSHSSLNSDQGSAPLPKSRHRVTFRGAGPPNISSGRDSPLRMVSSAHQDASQIHTQTRSRSPWRVASPTMPSSSRLRNYNPFARTKPSAGQEDDIFHDAISDNQTRPSSPFMSVTRPHTGMGMHPSDLRRYVYDTSPSMPFVDARVRSSASAPTSMTQHYLSNNVVLVVEPAHCVLNMFGALQVTGNYSLSGMVRVSLPHSMDNCRAVDVQSLQVSFTGYSVYIDSSGRFSSVRLCDLKQELVPTRATLQLPPDGAPMYECEFDMFVPGWLPASFSTRSVCTFYNLDAEATLCDVLSQDLTSATTAIDATTLTPAFSTGSRRVSKPIHVHSVPNLVVIQRSREVVPIPVAQTAAFLGPDVPITSNPFRRETNPFRHLLRAEGPEPPFATSSSTSSSSISATTPPQALTANLPPSSDQSDGGRESTSLPTPTPSRTQRMNRAPLRHHTHIAKLHMPTPVTINGTTHTSLPVKLCLSVPAYSSTHATTREEQPPLIFGLQAELDSLWQQAKAWCDVRICEMEAVCVQMEKYSSSLSRSYCTAFSLDVNETTQIPSSMLPFFDDVPIHAGVCTPQSSMVAQPNRMPQPYSRALVENRVRLEQTGHQPSERQNTIERLRAYTVGPLPTMRERQAKDERRAAKDDKSQASSTPRRRRTVTNALSRLSMFSPQRDSAAGSGGSSTTHTSNYGNGAGTGSHGGLSSILHGASSSADDGAHGTTLDTGGGSTGNATENTKASYVFDGEDGCGLALSRKRVRLSFSLPLVPSHGFMALKYNTPQLLPDYESPHMRIRHKLKVKVRFGFGSSLIGTPVGMQSVVMSVPVRFSEAPPKEALSQAPPLVLPKQARTYVPSNGAPNAALPPSYVHASYSTIEGAQGHSSYLPAYTQLFREDGSRLEDDAEVLPPYPDQPPIPVAADQHMFAAQLAAALYVVPERDREAKTPAAISMLDAFNAEDQELYEMAQEVDDEMMDERLANDEVPFEDDDDMTAARTARSGADHDGGAGSPLLEMQATNDSTIPRAMDMAASPMMMVGSPASLHDVAHITHASTYTLMDQAHTVSPSPPLVQPRTMSG